jgi:hypothetical protein
MSTATRRPVADTANRIQDWGSVTPKSVEDVAQALLRAAENEEQTEAQILNMWTRP